MMQHVINNSNPFAEGATRVQRAAVPVSKVGPDERGNTEHRDGPLRRRIEEIAVSEKEGILRMAAVGALGRGPAWRQPGERRLRSALLSRRRGLRRQAVLKEGLPYGSEGSPRASRG